MAGRLPDNVAVVKCIVVVVVLVFVVQAQAELRNGSQQGRSGALPRHRTCHRQQWRGGGGGRKGAGGGIFIAAGVIVPSIGDGSGGGVNCCPRYRNEDARVVTVVASVEVSVNGTAMAVAAVIVVFVVLTAAVTIAIAAAAAQPLLPLSLLVDCCLLEVLECLGVDVVEGLAESPQSGTNETSDVVDIDDSISGASAVDDNDNNNDKDNDSAINGGGGTAIPKR